MGVVHRIPVEGHCHIVPGGSWHVLAVLLVDSLQGKGNNDPVGHRKPRVPYGAEQFYQPQRGEASN